MGAYTAAMRALRVPCAALVLAAAVPAQILINEVFTDNPDYIELINAGTAPVDLSGYSIHRFESRGNSTPCATPAPGALGLAVDYTFPSGSQMLAPGAVVNLKDSSTASTPGIYVGHNLTFYDASDLVLWVEDPSGSVTDLLMLGDAYLEEMASGAGGIPVAGNWMGTQVVRPSFNGDVIARINDIGVFDTDSAFEWQVLPNGAASPGAVNPSAVSPLASWGLGTAASGNCVASGNNNDATVRPVLTFADMDDVPRVGGTFQFHIASGINGGPTADAILIGVASFQPGIAICPGVGGPELWVDPILELPNAFPTYDAEGGADSIALPIAAGSTLAGVTLFAQGFLVDPAEPCLPLRTTQLLEFRIM